MDDLVEFQISAVTSDIPLPSPNEDTPLKSAIESFGLDLGMTKPITAGPGNGRSSTPPFSIMRQNDCYCIHMDATMLYGYSDEVNSALMGLMTWLDQRSPDDKVSISIQGVFMSAADTVADVYAAINGLIGFIHNCRGTTVGSVDALTTGYVAYIMLACKELSVGAYGSLLIAPLARIGAAAHLNVYEDFVHKVLLKSAVYRGILKEGEVSDMIDNGNPIVLTAEDLKKRAEGGASITCTF